MNWTTNNPIEVGREYHIRRGDILLVDLQGAQGDEKYGRRPAVVVQSDIGNENSSTTIIAPITSQYDADELYPFEVELTTNETGLDHDSIVQLNQLRTITVSERVVKVFDWVNDKTMREIDDALKHTLGLD